MGKETSRKETGMVTGTGWEGARAVLSLPCTAPAKDPSSILMRKPVRHKKGHKKVRQAVSLTVGFGPPLQGVWGSP